MFPTRCGRSQNTVHPHQPAGVKSSLYSPDFSIGEAAFVAFEARRRAEAAPGVGSRLTDLIYIGQEIVPLDEELMEKFKSAYETLRQREDESRSTWRMVMRPAANAPDGETTMEETDAGQN